MHKQSAYCLKFSGISERKETRGKNKYSTESFFLPIRNKLQIKKLV
ncbi:MAG TPA: hypothetical protein VFM28_09510 [Nitrososphaeraceae archaeon]|nr:hypothetical protein [Nitrososphaeraceae archaeon]